MAIFACVEVTNNSRTCSVALYNSIILINTRINYFNKYRTLYIDFNIIDKELYKNEIRESIDFS